VGRYVLPLYMRMTCWRRTGFGGDIVYRLRLPFKVVEGFRRRASDYITVSYSVMSLGRYRQKMRSDGTGDTDVLPSRFTASASLFRISEQASSPTIILTLTLQLHQNTTTCAFSCPPARYSPAPYPPSPPAVSNPPPPTHPHPSVHDGYPT
jgi:hypothetical protein